MNAIVWMLQPPKPQPVGQARVHRIAKPEDDIPFGDAPKPEPKKRATSRAIDADERADREARVLQALKSASAMVNANEIERTTGIPDRSVRRYIKQLITDGQPIEAKNGYGYRWVGP